MGFARVIPEYLRRAGRPRIRVCGLGRGSQRLHNGSPGCDMIELPVERSSLDCESTPSCWHEPNWNSAAALVASPA